MCCYSYSREYVLTGADSLVHVSQDALPGDAFALSLNKVWEVIKSQKDLNLPAHKVCCQICHLLLSTVRVTKLATLQHARDRLAGPSLAHSMQGTSCRLLCVLACYVPCSLHARWHALSVSEHAKNTWYG